MPTRRDVFFITTGPNQTLQRELANRTRAMSQDDQDILDVEVFSHNYDPEAFRAWLEAARNPMVNGRRALDIAPTMRPAIVLPVGSTVTTTGGTVGPDGQYRGGATVTIHSPGGEPLTLSLGAVPGAALMAAAAQRQNPNVIVGTPVVDPPGTTGVPANTDYPDWDRLLALINELPAQQQTDVCMQQIESFMKALRALNVSLYAFGRFRRLLERKWGFFAYSSDQYYDGVTSENIRNRLQVPSYQPGTSGEWREFLSRSFRVTYPGLYQFGPGEVIFGLLDDYNSGAIGCRSSGASTTAMPNQCYAPTGEVHRVWLQPNGSILGGKLYTPAQMGAVVTDNDALDRLAGTRVMAPHARPNTGYTWDVPVFESHTPSVGRWRLHALPPLRFYWELFFAPQAEFDNKSFCEWLRSQDVRELIRATRRDNTLRNAEMASHYGTTINRLIGQAETDLAQEQVRAERRRQEVESYVQVGGQAATQVAGAINPIAGLVAGIGSFVARIVARVATEPEENVRIDVLGQLMPAFSQFAMIDSKQAFQGMMERQIGMPPGITVPPYVAPDTSVYAITGPNQPNNALNPPPPPPPPPASSPEKGMSTGAKVAVAGLLVTAIVGTGFAVNYAMKPKRKPNKRRSSKHR